MSVKNQTLILAERISKKLVAEQTKARLALAFDAAILAAHKVFGMGPGRAADFRDAYMDAMEELASMFIEDADRKTGNGDRDLAFAKAKRDEAIRKIVGDELFVSFDRDYGSAYIDELRRIRIMEGAMATAKRLDDAKAALTSCVSILAAVTGQPDAVLGKWLDLYYQIRRAYEIERGAEQDPRLLCKDDLYPVLRELLKEALGKPGKTDCHVAGAPRNDGKCETVAEAKNPGPWVKYKQRITDALREARARGVTMARIAEASGGVLTEHRVMDALNAAKLGQEEWRALDAALAVIEAESAADE